MRQYDDRVQGLEGQRAAEDATELNRIKAAYKGACICTRGIIQ
jgi:hypothetical protein